MGQDVHVIDVAAHTSHHIAFYIPNSADHETGPVRSVATRSLPGAAVDCLKGHRPTCFRPWLDWPLPAATKVCCAHEYKLGLPSDVRKTPTSNSVTRR